MRLRDDLAAIAGTLSARPQAVAAPRAHTTRRAG
jgi:hypothetical protein